VLAGGLKLVAALVVVASLWALFMISAIVNIRHYVVHY
jgi:hypothetical protein